MSESSLIPVEQKNVLFYEDEITAVVVQSDSERVVYIPLRPVCDYLGLAWSGQFERIKRDQVLSEVARSVRVTRTDLPPDSSTPRTSDVLAIPLDYINGWLFGVNVSRVKPELRERLITYQRECYRVLSRHFTTAATAATSTPATSALMQVREMGLAIARMAEEQMEMEARLGKTEIVAQATAVSVVDLQRRMEGVEAKLAPPDYAVTNAQASQIGQAVRAVGMVYGKQTGRVEYGSVYGELYRKYDVTSYHLVPAEKFEEVMKWLSDWYQALTNEELPF
jgi:hypothetical protein